MKTTKRFIAQARSRGEWFDLTHPTNDLEVVRWFLNDVYYANKRIKFPSHIWDAVRIKLVE